jgi:hypothetical protein
MKGAAIRVHVERVVLDGLELAARELPAVQDALAAELERLLAERGLHAWLAEGGALPTLRGGSIAVTPAGAPGELGTRIGQALGAALSPAADAPGPAQAMEGQAPLGEGRA